MGTHLCLGVVYPLDLEEGSDLCRLVPVVSLSENGQQLSNKGYDTCIRLARVLLCKQFLTHPVF